MAASTAGTNGHAVPVRIGGQVYPSARQAALAVGLSSNTVVKRCHSPTFPDYEWLGATPGRRQVHDPNDVKLAKPLIEPDRWPNDGGARRAPVRDPNCDPPRVVRQVGWLRCMCCCRSHFSEDVARARMCVECGGAGGWPVGARDEDA
jgi:hypothetical protein